MRIPHINLLVFMSILLGKDSLYPQQHLRFNQQVLHLQGQVLEVLLKDFNGDEALDILVQHNQSNYPNPHIDRFLSIFLQEDGVFPDHPNQTITANRGEILFDIGDIDGDNLPELLFLREDGVYARKFTTTGYTRTLYSILKTPSVFLSHDPSKLRRYPFIDDFNKNGVPDLLIPHPHELRIYSRTQAGNYTLAKRLWYSPEFTLSTQEEMTLSLYLPSLHIGDFNGDAIPDLLIPAGDRLDVYLQHPTVKTERQEDLIPPNLRYRMGARAVSPSILDQIAPASLTLEVQDLNGDGYVDILLSKASRGSFTTSISQIQIYMNKSGRFDLLPDQVLTAENFGGEHIIRDFNRDGLLDLALLTFRIGFAQAAKFLITKKAGSTYDFYLMRQDHTYPSKPNGKISFSRKVNINALFSSAFCQSFEGDFNSDGLQDLLIGSDSNELSIILGQSQGFFSHKAAHKIHAPISSHLWVGNLNRDGFSDIILWYPQNPNLSHQVLLIQSDPP